MNRINTSICIAIHLLVIFFFVSCKVDPSEISSQINLVDAVETSLHNNTGVELTLKMAKIDSIEYQVVHRTKESILADEGAEDWSSERIEKRLHELGSLVYFKFRRIDHRPIKLSTDPKVEETERAEEVEFLSFKAANNFKIFDEAGNENSPVLFHFEDGHGVFPGYTFSLAFDLKDIAGDEYYLTYIDEYNFRKKLSFLFESDELVD